MKLLITQRELMRPGGTELITIDIARGFAERGHEVAVYCPLLNDTYAIQLGAKGVAVRARIADLPWTPDIIHGQQHLQAMAALAAYPQTRALYFWHGVRPWVDRVPLHRRITRYATHSAFMVPLMTAQFSVAADRIAVVSNFIDPERFVRVRKPRPRPVRALLYHGYTYSRGEIENLAAACAANGLTFDKIGPSFGHAIANPEAVLPGYDLVFATGRSAVEALASGCGVIPIHSGRAGQLIRPATLDEWRDNNFAPRMLSAATARQFTPDWLAGELARWVPDELGRVTQRVRETLTREQALEALEAAYRVALESPLAPDDGGEFAPYLERLANDVDAFWVDAEAHRRAQGLVERVEGRLNAITASTSWRVTAPLRWMKRIARTGQRPPGHDWSRSPLRRD